MTAFRPRSRLPSSFVCTWYLWSSDTAFCFGEHQRDFNGSHASRSRARPLAAKATQQSL